MEELTNLRTETGKMFDAGKDKTGRPSYTLEARTGPIHFKDAYRDTDPWLDLDESYCEPGEIKGIGRVLVYPKLPNIVTVFQDRCGYQIQSRSNPDHVARVELVSIDGQNATAWQDSAALKTSVRVHPYRVGIWKDFSAASKAKATTMRWKVTELGNNGKDSHPFAFREVPEAYNVADLTNLDPEAMEQAKIAIQTARTRIDDNSWYWDELIPAEAKLVDTDWQVGASGNDGQWIVDLEAFSADSATLTIGQTEASLDINTFCRFTNVGISCGSIIISAYLTYTKNTNVYSGTTCSTRLYCDKSGNPAAPTQYSDIVNATRTSAYVSWTIPAWSDSGYNAKNTLSLVSIVQEVVNLPAFQSGNSMMFYHIDYGSTDNAYRTVMSYDTNPSYAPKLTATWTELMTRFPYHYNNMRP